MLHVPAHKDVDNPAGQVAIEPKQRKIVPTELLDAVEENWKERVLNGVSRGSKDQELEFFVGAMSAFAQVGFDLPPRWVIAAIRGKIVPGTKAQWAAARDKA